MGKVMVLKKILMIHCGGTLGMVNSEDGYKTERGFLPKLLKRNKKLNDEVYIQENEISDKCLGCKRKEEFQVVNCLEGIDVNISNNFLLNKVDFVDNETTVNCVKSLVGHHQEKLSFENFDFNSINLASNGNLRFETVEKNNFENLSEKYTRFLKDNISPELAMKDNCNCNNYVYTTPLLQDGKRITYEIIELNTIIDSSNATLKDWFEVLTILENLYDLYDGFVMIHGTDTMTYASSFFSFMIENLSKPIVFTGSMIPMQTKKREGEKNLLNSLIVASSEIKPGVYLQCANLLHKGNKASKISSCRENSFWSDKPILFDDYKSLYYIKPSNPTSFYKNYESRIAILKVYPEIQSVVVKCILENNRGVVLETFGSGNAFNDRKDLLELIKNYIKAGVVVVNVSQCLEGVVNNDYEANNGLFNVGVISGQNMTTEAAFCKLAYLLGNYSINNIQISRNDFVKLFFEK